MRRDTNFFDAADPPPADHPEGEAPKRANGHASGPDIFPFEIFANIAVSTDAMDFVEGMLIKESMVVIYGEPGSGKTFWVADLFLHVACGWAYNKLEVEQGAIIYVVAEGARGLRHRIAAFREHHGIGSYDIPFVIVPTQINLRDPKADTSKLIETIKTIAETLGKPIAAVVIDTLARALSGGNENAPDDMGAIVANGGRIQAECRVCLVWIHHCGKDAAKGARGHSSLLGATDTEIEITCEGKGKEAVREAHVTKQRDLECTGAWRFQLKSVALGNDSRGKAITSCIVTPAEGAPATGTAHRLAGHGKRALEVLQNLCAASGQSGHHGLPEHALSVPEEWWRERFYERTPADTQDTKKKAFQRASLGLVNDHIVGMSNGRVWIVARGGQL